MEKSTPIGLLIGFSMMIGVLFVGEAKVSLLKFIDPPAMMMVFGGAVAVALVGFPLRQVLRLFAIGKKLFFHQHEDPRAVIDQIVELAEIARKDGLLALERKTEEGQNPLLVLGVQLAVDGRGRSRSIRSCGRRSRPRPAGTGRTSGCWNWWGAAARPSA